MENIVIIGGGLVGSLLALKILKETKHRVTMIEDPTHIGKGGIGGESLTPSFIHLVLGVVPSITECLAYSDAFLKWGNVLKNWGEEDIYIPQFVYKDTPYNHNISKYLEENTSSSLEDIYANCTPAVEYMRSNNLSVNGGLEDWSVNLDSGKLTEYLQPLLEGNINFRHIKGVAQPEVLNNTILNIKVNGEEVTGYLYIDNTGVSRKLISKLDNLEYLDLKGSFINNSAVYGSIDPTHKPYVTSRTATSGWVWEIPLESKTSVGYVYCSEFIKKSKALQELKTLYPNVRDTVSIKYTPTRLTTPWVSNVITIGSGVGIVDPLEANILLHSKLHIEEIMKFLKLNAPVSYIHSEKFNTACNDAWEGMSSFLELHYRGCLRQDTKYWNHVTNIPKMSRGLKGFINYNTCKSGYRNFDWEKWAILALGLKVLSTKDLLR